MIRKVLVPLDGSGLAESVLPVVEELAPENNWEVVLLQVVQPIAERLKGKQDEIRKVYVDDESGQVVLATRVPGTEETVVNVIDEEVDELVIEACGYLDEVQEQLRKKGVKNVRSITRYGQAPSKIIDVVKQEGIDMVAMSTHGRSGISRMVYGTVMGTVMRGVTVPVLVVRSPGTGPTSR